MRVWEKKIARRFPEEKVVVHYILDGWIALLAKGHPVPAPKTKWERRTAKGFAILLKGLRGAGAEF
jgi:hypothetical protein